MIQEILEGIARIIHIYFPNDHIYIEPVEQNLIEPCHVISRINGSTKRRIGGNRHSVEEDFQIAILAQTNAEIYERMETLSLNLDLIPLNDSDILTYDMQETNISDGQASLTFTVYRTMVKETEEIPKMETLSFNTEILK